jgi:hypothetical protein
MLPSDVHSGMDIVLRSLWNCTLIRKNDAVSTVRQGHRVRGCVIGTGLLVLLGY